MPEDLVVPNVPFSFSGTVEKSHLRKEAAEALEKLFLLAKQDGIQLNAVSGFRSYEYQKGLYANNVKRKGKSIRIASLQSQGIANIKQG